jgi:hypothetical protein
MVSALAFAIGASSSRQGNKDAAPSVSIAINLRQDAIISDSETPLEVTITNISNLDPSPQAIPQGVSLAISGPRHVVKAGSQVWLKVSLSNHSPGNMGAPGDDSDFCYTIDVYDEKGIAAPKTEFGRQCKQDMLTIKVTSDTGPIFVVRPGGTWTGKVEVTKLVNMRRPGKYAIQMHYGKLLSNRIAVTVTE